MSTINPRALGAAVFGALMAALIMGSVILFLRGDDNAPIQVLLPSSEQLDAISDSRGRSPFNAPGTTGELKVHVSGAVRNPGVYTLRPGARLSDAVETAGGTTSDASEGAVNLAQPLRDGEQYHIPRLGDTPPSPNNQPLEPTPSGYCRGLIDLNSA